VHTEVPRPLAGERRRLATGTVDNRRSSATHRPEHTESAAPDQRERGTLPVLDYFRVATNYNYSR